MRWSKKVNEQLLSDLPVGDTTDFYQLGDLLILDAEIGPAQPYVRWIQQQDGVVSGTITMTKKGGAFDRGAIQVDGVLSAADRTQFETALRKFSKKQITYPEG